MEMSPKKIITFISTRMNIFLGELHLAKKPVRPDHPGGQ